jgi:type IV secretion system protein VirB1
MSAIVVYESGANPYAIDDDTERQAYFPNDRASAEALASRLLRAGHTIDVGYAQINSGNFGRFGLDVHSALDPCTNLATGARILRGFYRAAASLYGPGQAALVHALSAYNTGRYWAGMGYARGVAATAAALRYEAALPFKSGAGAR